MTELESLLAAVKDRPGDDTPRLVLADWLEEHGQESRAEFIRVQCELARICSDAAKDARNGTGEGLHGIIPPQPIQDRCRELRYREQSLISKHGRDWFAVTPYVTWHRGFLSRILCPWEEWRTNADRILSDPWVPGLDEVVLTGWQWLGPVPWFTDPTPENAEGFLRLRWRAVRKWTLRPEERLPRFTDSFRRAGEFVRNAGVSMSDLAEVMGMVQGRPISYSPS